MILTVHNSENLCTLRELAANDERFDLIELDGPYGAGLEGWDILDDDAYLAHYAERLVLVQCLLQPWGVTFLFGYPEMCALVRTWAAQTGTLYLRRWLTWYVQQTAHAARRTQTVLVFTLPSTVELLPEFRAWLKGRRLQLGLSLREARALTGVNAELLDNPRASSGGYFWYEAECANLPSRSDYEAIKLHFGTPDYFDALPNQLAFDGLTNLDFISVPVERAASLNDNGLRSKPIGLYDTLFRPVVPPHSDKRALIMYGGSGNAAIAAGKLGYDVTVCETDPARCDLIRRRWAWQVEHRDETPFTDLGPLFAQEQP
jgi:hypothetical protein